MIKYIIWLVVTVVIAILAVTNSEFLIGNWEIPSAFVAGILSTMITTYIINSRK